MQLLITNYSQWDSQFLIDSWKAQFHDCRLKDFSDTFGILEFKSLLPSDLKVKDPYIFKLTKNGCSFMLIGTFHLLPLSIYPQNLIDILLSNKIIVVEYSGLTPVTEDETVNCIEQNNQLVEQDWLEDFSIYDQQFLNHIFHDIWPEYSKLSFLEFDHGLNNKTPDIITKGWSLLSKDKIDSQLFNAENFTQHYHLDTQEEHYSTDDSKDTWTEYYDVKSEETFKDFVYNQMNYPMMMNLISEYISGTKGREDASSLLSIQERNLNWVERFKVIEHLPDILVTVGYNHLFYENGLLPLWNNQGWNIERVDLAGEWHKIELNTDGFII